jgi:hypothetical protein
MGAREERGGGAWVSETLAGGAAYVSTAWVCAFKFPPLDVYREHFLSLSSIISSIFAV